MSPVIFPEFQPVDAQVQSKCTWVWLCSRKAIRWSPAYLLIFDHDEEGDRRLDRSLLSSPAAICASSYQDNWFEEKTLQSLPIKTLVNITDQWPWGRSLFCTLQCCETLHTKPGGCHKCFVLKKIIQLGCSGACWHDLIALLQLLSRVPNLFVTVVKCCAVLHFAVLPDTNLRLSLYPWEMESCTRTATERTFSSAGISI